MSIINFDQVRFRLHKGADGDVTVEALAPIWIPGEPTSAVAYVADVQVHGNDVEEALKEAADKVQRELEPDAIAEYLNGKGRTHLVERAREYVPLLLGGDCTFDEAIDAYKHGEIAEIHETKTDKEQ